MLLPITSGQPPQTHTATAVLLGLDAVKASSIARGPVEAAGAGRTLASDQIALRANFATVKPAFGGLITSDRRAGRIHRETGELARAISGLDLGDGVSADFQPTDQHRGVVILTGPGLSDKVSDTDPGDEELPAPVLRCQALQPEARLTAEKINLLTKKTHEILDAFPVNQSRVAHRLPAANGLLLRGAGGQLALHGRVTEAGLRAALVCACNTARGLGSLLGFEVYDDPRFTGNADTDVAAKFECALQALENHDLVFVHVKAPDICAHDRKPGAKRDFIERLDQAMAPLLERPIVTTLTTDHATDSNTGRHTNDPVPALVWSPNHGPGILGVKFGEEACRSGSMPKQASSAFLDRVLALAGLQA